MTPDSTYTPDPGSTVPDVPPILGFRVLDVAETVLDQPLTTWQKRVVLDLYGAGPSQPAPKDPS